MTKNAWTGPPIVTIDANHIHIHTLTKTKILIMHENIEMSNNKEMLWTGMIHSAAEG